MKHLGSGCILVKSTYAPAVIRFLAFGSIHTRPGRAFSNGMVQNTVILNLQVCVCSVVLVCVCSVV